MQFRRLLATATLSATLASVSTAAPAIKFVPAFPNLTIAKPVTTAIIPGTDRELLLAQGGVIYELPKDREASEAAVWFDLTSRVQIDKDFEEGLLGIAFHPKFESNKKFYIYYSRQGPKRSIVSEFAVGEDGKPTLDSERILLEIGQPYWNHDSGLPLFGSDGFLYISTGDGGKGNDPLLNGQDTFTLLSKILRIDVDSRSGDLPYGIPEDNPFVGKPGFRAEVYAYGMRNPWGMHFDKKGRLWCADVGQAMWEEINIIEKGGNYGWSFREGAHDFVLNRNPPFIEDKKNPAPELIDPVHDYSHAFGISVTGGLVYEGEAFPELKGKYIYGDWGSGFVWALAVDDDNKKISNEVIRERNGAGTKKGQAFQPTHFTQRPDGEIWALSWDGKIYEMIKG